MSSSGKGEWLSLALEELLEAGRKNDETRLLKVASKLYRIGVILEFIGNHVLISLERRKKDDIRPSLRLQAESYAWDVIELFVSKQFKVPPINLDDE